MDTQPVTGNILPLSRAVGAGSDDVAVLSAMLIVGENPLRTESKDCVWWTFVNSGVEFCFTDGTLSAVDMTLVYDRTGSFNGIVVPSWLVESWWCRPTSAQVQQTFGTPTPAVVLREDGPTSSAGTEVFDLDSAQLRADYDADGSLCAVSLTAA